MEDAVIIDTIRTAVGKKNGALKDVHPVDLLVPILQKLTERNNIDPDQIDDVVTGCATMTGDQGVNIGRLAVLAAGFPVEIPAFSLNRLCGSSQQAIHNASQAIAAGDMDIVIACGVESMSRVPMGSDVGEFPDSLVDKHAIIPQGFSAEQIAAKWEISRESMDEYSLLSHQRAMAAANEGKFEREIIPIEVVENDEKSLFTEDEGIRRDTSVEKLAQLTPAFLPDEGAVTAGNSSQMSDGAAGMLLMSETKAKELQLTPRAKVIARVVVGEDPIMMLTGVIPATKKVLEKAGLTIDDMDVIEINEAFASVIQAWEKEIKPDMNRVNPRGGAIALGHPLGASGVRLATTLIHTLEDQGGKYGLQVMCIGFGMATATIYKSMV